MGDLELCYTCERWGKCDVYRRLSSLNHNLLYSCVDYRPQKTDEVQEGMNHDYAHCLDYTKDCPTECFRAELQRDIEESRSEFVGVPLTYAHLDGTEECKLAKDKYVTCKMSLELPCDGCRFVGTLDTDFPCSRCIRREKDYYEQER